jgi:hypothetical protein
MNQLPSYNPDPIASELIDGELKMLFLVPLLDGSFDSFQCCSCGCGRINGTGSGCGGCQCGSLSGSGS